MKWMWSTALVVAVSAAVSAHPGQAMNTPMMADDMKMTYTGCIVAVNHGGSFLLTDVSDDHDTMMPHDREMKNESETAEKREMDGNHMTSRAFVLTGRSDLKKHAGQRVTVTGSLSNRTSETTTNDPGTLAVASLKVVAKSCREYSTPLR